MTAGQILSFYTALAIIGAGVAVLSHQYGIRRALRLVASGVLILATLPVALAAVAYLTAREWWRGRRRKPGHHRAEDHQDIVPIGYQPARTVAGHELPQRPKGNEALKAEIAHGWRPYTDRTVTTARVGMVKDWPTEEPTGALVLAGAR